MLEKQESKKDTYFWHIIFTLGFLTLFALTVILLYNLGKFPRSMPVFDFIILGLAVFRLTHLFVYDYIMNFVRDYFARFDRGPGKSVSNLLSCEWCTGIWMALFVLFIYFLSFYAWYFILAIALAGVGTFLDIVARRIMRK